MNSDETAAAVAVLSCFDQEANMIEKVNPMHPDKVADRIAGALVDLAYTKRENPRLAVEVLIGHRVCHIIAETSVQLDVGSVARIATEVSGYRGLMVNYREVPQDVHLSENQKNGIRCGDNGIFRGMPLTEEQKKLSRIARAIYDEYPCDGKYILGDGRLIICQSNADEELLSEEYPEAIINPLGHWTGGIDVDSGATNRKLGSDMADSVTGGGLHGKDLSKADVSANIYAFLKAQETGKKVEMFCAIGDDEIRCHIGDDVTSVKYGDIVALARKYVKDIGGFEKLAEWGLF